MYDIKTKAMIVSREGTPNIDPSKIFALALKTSPYACGCKCGKAIEGCDENLTVSLISRPSRQEGRDIPRSNTSNGMKEERRSRTRLHLTLKFHFIEKRELASEVDKEEV